MLQIFHIGSQPNGNIEFSGLEDMPEWAGKSDEQTVWVNMEDPNAAEIKYISDIFLVPDGFLSDPLDPAERSRASHMDDTTLIIARASYHSEKHSEAVEICEEQNYPTVPIGIVISKGAIITVCRIPDLVKELLAGKINAGKSRKRVCMAARLLEKISTRFIRHLQKLDALTGEIEESMHQSTRNEDLRRILQIEKTLVYFLNAIKANALALEKLLTNTGFAWDAEERERLADALIECRQAVDMGEVFTQITGHMSDIYASMISNNMNTVMKFLAAVTLILMAPTIVVGLYGMNVPLPFQEKIWALPIIVMGIIGVCVFLWRFLLKRHWM